MSNNIVEQEWKYWNGNQWENNSKRLFYYNSNNERTHEEGFNWDIFDNEWYLSYCDEYTYQVGKPIMQIEQFAWPQNACADTSGMKEWLYLGNNLSYEASFGYATNTFNLTEETTFFCNSILLANTAIPTYQKAYFSHSLGLFENQIDSVTSQQGSGFATYKYHYSAFASTSIQEHTTTKKLLKITDLLGREIKGKKNEPLLYIYDDGTVEKRIFIE